MEIPGVRGRSGRVPLGVLGWGFDLGCIISLMKMVIRDNPQNIGGPQGFWHTMQNGDKVGVQGVENRSRSRILDGVTIVYKRKFDDSHRMLSRWQSGYVFSCVELSALRALEGVISDLLWRQFIWAGRAEEEYLMGVGYSEHDLLLAEIAEGKNREAGVEPSFFSSNILLDLA